ncbi:alpha/beta fold hydrolase [Tomitella fengzijianii]|uniref:Alpha/beta fold hydrolase n=1 Tax=Tomitella fengzijianii TaxID=2597660 RepID=A0A516X702_9ACTN|nr:alpha/beta fold hydrolase [Tomitella fengzijianii]QDQ98854.1 alpha/beta fold hydrolase [Tomitella fengzijianii]
MELAYDIRGEGPTLVLVHGVIHRRHAWDPVVDLLARHRRVVTVDLPGHGDSPEMPAGANPLQIGMDLAVDFLREIAPDEKVHVAGNSLGGWFALEAAARGEVASATGLSPAGFFANALDQARTVNTFRALRWATRRMGGARDAFVGNPVGKSVGMGVFMSHPWRVPAATARIDAASLLSNKVIDRGLNADFSFTRPVDQSVPVTVAWGRRDLVLPCYEAKRVRGVFPQAEVTIVPGVGHVPMWDNPQLVASILLAGSAGPTVPRGASGAHARPAS